jgi:hypothetical protein
MSMEMGIVLEEDREIDWVTLDVLEGAKLAILALKSIQAGSPGAVAFIDEQIRRVESTLGELYDAAEATVMQQNRQPRPRVYEVPLAHHSL